MGLKEAIVTNGNQASLTRTMKAGNARLTHQGEGKGKRHTRNVNTARTLSDVEKTRASPHKRRTEKSASIFGTVSRQRKNSIRSFVRPFIKELKRGRTREPD